MARKKRPRRVTSGAATPAGQRTATPALSDWKWRTFPVLFAFAAGMLLMALLNGTPNNTVAAIAQIVALAAVGYGASRIFVRKVIWERRMRDRGVSPRSRDEPDEEYEDVVVYPENERRGV